MTRAPGSQAIGTKLHAMYGRRLTQANYESMLRERSVGAIAGYLKHETRFYACLGNMQEATIHRGQLEMLLGRALFDEVSRLQKYDRSGRLFSLYEARLELQLITNCVGFLREGQQDHFLVSVPGYLLGRIRLDLDGMVRAKDAQQLAAVLAHTRYGKAFQRMLAQTGGTLPAVSVCAAQLGYAYYSGALHEVETRYDSDERDQLRRLLLTQVETTNLTVAYRMKKYFQAQPEQIWSNLIPIFHTVKKRFIEQLIRAPDAAAFERLLLDTRAGRHLRPQDFSFIEYSTAEQRLRMSHRAFMYATSPAVAFLAFLMMREIELSNILSIVEGVRYGVPADEIQKLLILL